MKIVIFLFTLILTSCGDRYASKDYSTDIYSNIVGGVRLDFPRNYVEAYSKKNGTILSEVNYYTVFPSFEGYRKGNEEEFHRLGGNRIRFTLGSNSELRNGMNTNELRWSHYLKKYLDAESKRLEGDFEVYDSPIFEREEFYKTEIDGDIVYFNCGKLNDKVFINPSCKCFHNIDKDINIRYTLSRKNLKYYKEIHHNLVSLVKDFIVKS